MTKGLHALNNLLLVHGNLEHMWVYFLLHYPCNLITVWRRKTCMQCLGEAMVVVCLPMASRHWLPMARPVDKENWKMPCLPHPLNPAAKHLMPYPLENCMLMHYLIMNLLEWAHINHHPILIFLWVGSSQFCQACSSQFPRCALRILPTWSVLFAILPSSSSLSKVCWVSLQFCNVL